MDPVISERRELFARAMGRRQRNGAVLTPHLFFAFLVSRAGFCGGVVGRHGPYAPIDFARPAEKSGTSRREIPLPEDLRLRREPVAHFGAYGDIPVKVAPRMGG